LVKIAGSKKLKRQMAPLFWGITRKEKRFVVTVRPGTQKKNTSISSAVFLRDMLKIVKTLREAKYAIYNGKVIVDGIIRKSLHHGIGLMDVIELDGLKETYRLVPKNGILLQPIIIDSIEKTKKLVQVKSKTTIKNNKTQVGFHDGRVLIDDTNVSVGDTCVMQIPEQKILDVIKLEKGIQGLITRGVNAGKIGTVDEIKEGTFILPKRVNITLEDRQIEIPASLIMPIGKEKPVIQIR
jgi:small subunit ribosomal protein S4e